MRRLTFIAMLITALGLSVPGAASAKHRSRNHHGAKHHAGARHHARARGKSGVKGTTLRFTPASVNAGTAPSGSSTPTTASPDSIGTVASFTNGVLTINLNETNADGTPKTISGKVTNDTEFQCEAPPSSTSSTTQTASTRDEGSGSSGSGDEGTQSTSGDDPSPAPSGAPTPAPAAGDDQASGDTEDANDANDANETDDANDDDNGATAGCDSSLLTPGTVVHEATLVISPSGGSVFKEISLFH